MRIFMILAFLLARAAIAAPAEPQSCENSDLYSLLDFWVGDWDVFVDDRLVGSNRIEKSLGGCAVFEYWEGSEGGRGISLFYVAEGGVWKQVWVTEWATRPGGIKEKTREELDDPNQVRFQGTIVAESGEPYLDRTTLTRLDNGDVRQLIEFSMDAGATWKPAFDAVYRRRPGFAEPDARVYPAEPIQ